MKYDYEELRAAATRANATQEDIDSLGAWFEQNGSGYWNGEYYDADGLRLFPIYREFYVVQVRFPGSDGWQDICTTDDPDAEIEYQKTIEDDGDCEYRAEIDHADIVGYEFK